MTNEQQLQGICVNKPARIVAGDYAGLEGTVVGADWERNAIAISIPTENVIAILGWHEVAQDGSEPVGVPAPQQPGTITWIKYDRENPPKTEKPYLVSDGFVIGEADLLLLRDGPWFSGPFAPADKDITHYAHINLPEVQA